MNFKTPFITILLFLPIYMLAQHSISGKIQESENGSVIESVNIILIPTKKGTVSNSKGQFEIKNISNGSYKLKVSMVGFITQNIKIVIDGKSIKQNILLTLDNKKIDEVKVVANYRQLELIENPTIEQASVMSTISTIKAKEIEKQGATTLIEALKYVPGGWTESRGRKVKQFFSIRGQKYPYPTYSINGIWQKEFHETTYFFNSTNIEEIKVIRSSSALVKSLSALTGIIDIKTKKPESKESNINLKYGSLNSYQAGASHGNSTGDISYNVGANVFGTDGPDGRNGKEGVWNLHGSADWQINSALDWTVNMFYISGSRELVQPIAPADAKFTNRKETYDPLNTLMISSRLRYQSGRNFGSELQINYADRKPNYINENLGNGQITEYDEKDHEITVNLINSLAIGDNNVLRFGALYNYWMAPNGKRFYYGKKGEIHTVSGVVADEHTFGKLLLDGGIRLTREYYSEWGGFSIEGSGGKFSKVAPIADEWQPLTWQATSGASYTLSQNNSLHLSVAGGIITPRSGALNEDGVMPDNELRMNYDLGFVRKIGTSGKLSVTGFLVNRKDAIEYSGSTIEVGENIMELYRNKNKRNYGIEIEARSDIWKNQVSVFSNITLMKGQIDEDGEWGEDDEMPNFIANLGSSYQNKRYDLNVYMNYTGAYKNDRFVSKAYIAENGKAPLGDFFTCDITTGYAVGEDKLARLYFELKNLFDTKYQTVAGYPDYGRMVSVGINMKI